MNLNEVVKKEHENIMQTYSRFNLALVSGKGACAQDTEGRKYIDFTSGIGVNCLGFCDDNWVNAVTSQAAKLQHTSNLFYNPVQVELAEKLCSLTGFSKVFFGNSGAEANECAIKLARKYGTEKYGENHNKIITLKNSFHGRTITTLSATGQDVFHKSFTPFTEGFFYADADIQSVKEFTSTDTCAIIIELIQGEGGVLPMNPQFVKELSEFCRKNDILLIVDEVQTGVGRTSKLYCFQNYGIMPDIITSAKGLGGGLPIGACLCSEKLQNVMGVSSHGSTFGGNPIVCAGALAALNKVSQDNFLNEVHEKGKYFTDRLKAIEEIEYVRGMGLMLGAKLKKDNAKEIAEKCVENGLLVLTAKNLLRFLPPLTITYEEMDKGINILENTLNNQ